jgi:Legume lectin domain/PEP-CTERM motif
MTRSILTSLGALAVLLCVVPHAQGDFVYSDFSSTAGLFSNDTQSAPVGSVYRLTRASFSPFHDRGGVEYNTPQHVSAATGWNTKFQFQITNPVGNGGQGFAFTLFPNSHDIGNGGTSMGVGFMDNVLSVEFDTEQQTWDPNDNHVSVNFAPGADPSAQRDDLFSVGSGTPSFDINDGAVHTAMINYDTDKTLTVYVDDMSTPLITVPNVNMSLLNLIGGTDLRAGFRSGITSNSKADHDILSWSFTEHSLAVPEPACAVLALFGFGVVGFRRRG